MRPIAHWSALRRRPTTCPLSPRPPRHERPHPPFAFLPLEHPLPSFGHPKARNPHLVPCSIWVRNEPVAFRARKGATITSSWEKFKMNAKELADKFNAKAGAAVAERQRQSRLAVEHLQRAQPGDGARHRRAVEGEILPFLAELKQHLGEGQFTFAPQIDLHDL